MASQVKKRLLEQDVAIIVMSVILALVLVETKALEALLSQTQDFKLLSSFIAGLFFTSVFTTAPAIVTLGQIAQSNSVFLTALFGAFGAVFGDLLIFNFVRDRLGEHLTEVIKHDSHWRRFKTIFKLRYFRWFTLLAGGLIIASPLPDELGISLLGFSKVKTSKFIFLSLIFNFLGILAIGLIANHL